MAAFSGKTCAIFLIDSSEFTFGFQCLAAVKAQLTMPNTTGILKQSRAFSTRPQVCPDGAVTGGYCAPGCRGIMVIYLIFFCFLSDPILTEALQ